MTLTFWGDKTVGARLAPPATRLKKDLYYLRQAIDAKRLARHERSVK